MGFAGKMWSQSGLPSVPGWNAGNGDHAQSGSQDWASYYQSMPANQVDWGSLAQQWIAMKTENTLPVPAFDDTEPPPPAPGEEHFANQQSIPAPTYPQWPPIHLPPPNLHAQENSKHQDEAPPLPPVPPLPTTPHPNSQPEGGVVDMDMDDEDDQAASSMSNSDWSVRPSTNSKTNISGDGYYRKQADLSNTTKAINTGNRGEYQRPSFGGPSPHPPGGGWIHKNNQGPGRGINNTNMAQIPALMGLSSNSVNMIDSSSVYSSHTYNAQAVVGSMANLDAAARKKLPPWIREGLEKMEREKLKKEEELMRKKVREEKLRKRREEELKMNERRKQDPGISKFDDMNSNSESDDDTNEYSTASTARDPFKKEIDTEQETNGKSSDGNISNRKRPSRFDEKNSSEDRKNDRDGIKEDDNIKAIKEVPKKHLTKDEILEEMSLILKRTLTEILLEVTSEEIQATAEESLASAQRQKSKSVVNAKIRANRAFKKNPISSLGLTGYGSGSDDSASESDKSDKKSEDNNTSDSDSDVELEERLKQRKRQFQRTENSILDECADLEKSLEKREKIWKEKESDSGRRRHESKSSNHSDYSDNRKNSPKVFETFSAAVNVLPLASDYSEAKNSRFETDENNVHSKQMLIPSASQSKVKDGSMTLNPIKKEKQYSSEEDNILYGKEKNSHSTIKEKQKAKDPSTSPEERHSKNERKHRHDSSRKERSKRSSSDKNESEKSERAHKSKRRSRSREKSSKKFGSPKTSKHQRHSRSRSRSRNRSEKRSSRRDRHRSRSKDRKSRDEEYKSSSSRRKRSTSRETRRSRRSRSRSTDNRRQRRHSSTSSETSTFSYASGNGNYSRRERRESQMSSSRKTRRRSRS